MQIHGFNNWNKKNSAEILRIFYSIFNASVTIIHKFLISIQTPLPLMVVVIAVV